MRNPEKAGRVGTRYPSLLGKSRAWHGGWRVRDNGSGRRRISAGTRYERRPRWQRRALLEAPVQHILTLSRTAVIVRHWFEIDLADASMEHGVRIELRELAAHPRRGSESAAQLVAVDRRLWRADLFDRLTDGPGTFGVAHYHPQFLGHEPCPRVWNAKLTANPWSWLGDQFAQLGAAGGTEPWPVDPADGPELSRLSAEIVSLARQLGPDRCRSAARCYALTWDAAESVRLMIEYLRRPDLLDEEWVASWRGTGVQDAATSEQETAPSGARDGAPSGS
jgi:hypothetical protein